MRLVPARAAVLVLSTLSALTVGVLSPAGWGGSMAHGSVPSPGASSHSHTHTTDVSVCKHAPRGRVRCFAIRVDRVRHGRVRHTATPTGYGPADLQRAYAVPTTATRSPGTIAIVDAYDDPTAAADLAVYRAQFGLPACTTTAHCLRIVGQTGGSSLPTADSGWAEEISLDLDMASAACPHCHLLLVEADSPSMANLGAAEDTAVRLGADAVSNSYGGADAGDSTYGRYYHHSGVAITASTGDNGYGVSFPASSRWVTAVSGTTLRPSTSARGFTESAWSGAGSGCSTLNAATWQDTALTSCSGRAVGDVAVDADPATGVAVYDSTGDDGARGWLTFGGTSAASPFVAGLFAAAGNTHLVTNGSWTWAHHAGLRDITSGSNGSCTTAVWCHAGRGWDGPTGWGVPDGLAAF